MTKELKVEKSRPWTNDDDTRIREMVLAGVSSREIAVSLGRTVNAVRARATRLVSGLAVTCRKETSS